MIKNNSRGAATSGAPRRLIGVVLGVVLLLTGTLAAELGGPAPAGASPVPTRSTLERSQAIEPDVYEARVHTLINKTRARLGKRKLRFHSCPDSFSERWAQHLAATGRFYHRSVRPVLRTCRARYVGEVIGRGYWAPGQMVRAWMRSTPHRRILLNGKPNKLGVGAVLDSRGRWVLTANTARIRR